MLPYWGNPHDRKVIRRFWSQVTSVLQNTPTLTLSLPSPRPPPFFLFSQISLIWVSPHVYKIIHFWICGKYIFFIYIVFPIQAIVFSSSPVWKEMFFQCFYFLKVLCVHVWLYVYYIHAGSQRGQKRSHQVICPGAGVIGGYKSLCKMSKGFQHRALSSVPCSLFFHELDICCYCDYNKENASKPHCTSSSHRDGRTWIVFLTRC